MLAPPAEVPPAEEVKAPTPPPPPAGKFSGSSSHYSLGERVCLFWPVDFSEPTSEPQELVVEDVNDTSVTIQWSAPATIGIAGLDGYTVECSKEGSKSVRS